MKLRAIVDLFIGAGANLNLQDNKGNTAYMLAQAFRHRDVVSALYLAGADTQLKNAECEQTIK